MNVHFVTSYRVDDELPRKGSAILEVVSDASLHLPSDADRDAAIARLTAGLADGRLSIDDFHQRLDAVHAARTQGELASLVVDLPAAALMPSAHSSVQRRRRRLLGRLQSYLGVNVVTWGVWGAQELSGQSIHDLWPLWLTIPWGAWIGWRYVSSAIDDRRAQLAPSAHQLPPGG
jgi:hypothetical protein